MPRSPKTWYLQAMVRVFPAGTMTSHSKTRSIRRPDSFKNEIGLNQVNDFLKKMNSKYVLTNKFSTRLQKSSMPYSTLRLKSLEIRFSFKNIDPSNIIICVRASLGALNAFLGFGRI